MWRVIVVGLDGSGLAERALMEASALAKATGARLRLVRAVSPADAARSDANGVDAWTDARQYLRGVAARLGERAIPADPVVADGEPAEAVVREGCEARADLITICTHGRSGLGRWLYGSVAEGILRRSPVPVMLVKSTLPVDGARLNSAAGIVVAVDGSAFAENALAPAAALGRAFGGRLTVVRAVPIPTPVVGEYSFTMVPTVQAMLSAEEDAAHAYADGVAARLRLDGICADAVVKVGPPADVILHACQAAQARLVVTATHGRTGLPRLVLGSVANELVHRAQLPVVFVRPAALVTAPIPAPRLAESVR